MNRVKLNGIYRLKKTGAEVKVVGYEIWKDCQSKICLVPVKNEDNVGIINKYFRPQDLEKIPEKLKKADGGKIILSFLKHHFVEGKNYIVGLEGDYLTYSPQTSLGFTKIKLTEEK